jgi:uncharacterized protein DUF3179
MKRSFYAGLLGLALFEALKVYFIMPMPGSQGINSLGFAYFLHTYRWVFRAAFILAIAAGCRAVFKGGWKWLPGLAAAAALAVVWLFNFQITADRMFLQPSKLTLAPRSGNSVGEASIVIGIERGGEAKAYPIRFLVYHHQVQDTIGGTPVIVTYCSVCRTGRVFEPTVGGKLETFRLVGMDHFNAMFEDASTHSWWRQATGEAVAGPRKGLSLPEVDASQVTLGEWFRLHPGSLVMQPDEPSRENYDTYGRFERGLSTGELTRTDRSSWLDKSWVVGIQVGLSSKAYDWRRLRAQRIINDRVGDVPVVLALSADQKSFAAFERPDDGWVFALQGDVLSANGRSFDLSGRDLAAPDRRLKSVNGHQEFWQSWRTFHPDTLQDI